MKVKVTMGDWSNDGHGMTQVDIVELPTVMSEDELNEMYKLGVDIVGYDMTEKVARGYENNSIDEDMYERLLTLGYDPYKLKRVKGMWDEFAEFNRERAIYYINPELYLDIYMFFVGLGYEQKFGTMDSFGYLIVSDDMAEARIGGYGLFYC
jgi:hypothetical protein